jgi:multidrug efflux system membrane fusion protein
MAQDAPVAGSSAPPPTKHGSPGGPLSEGSAALPATVPTTAPATDSPKPSGEFHTVWVVLALAIIGTVVGVVIYKHRTKPAARMPPPITISTTNAVRGNINETVSRIGTVTAIYTAMISPRVDGQLIKVNYIEGQMVTTNDLLVEIDPGPYQAQLTVAEGQLARDQAQLEGAKIDLDRFQAAYVKKAIPKQQVDDQLALVHQDEGTVKLDEGQVANAKVQLAYCFIHAPFNGRTGLRLVDPGNVVHAANTNALVVVAQLQPITVVFSPTEDELPAIQRQLQAGHKMTVEAYDRDQNQKLATGTFLTMDNLIDLATGTIRIKALFDNADLMLFPNQFVNVKLIIDTLTNVTLVPTAAIQLSPRGAFVYVVTPDQTVKMQSITRGITDVDISSVTGLEPDAVIATDNFNKLGDGMKVNVRQPGAEGQRGGARGGKKHGGNKDKALEDPS